MTREEFIEILDRKDYRYKIVGDDLIINQEGSYIDLDEIEILPDNIIFNNRGDIWLKSVRSIPKSVKFMNSGDVSLDRLTGDFFEWFDGNIEGIGYRRLLNHMVSKDVFI